MRKIKIHSPYGDITLEDGAGVKPRKAGQVIETVARCFMYTAILSGLDTGVLLDENDVPLNNEEYVAPGEYKLLVLC